MQTNSYQDAKDFIFTKLNKVGSPLARAKIKHEVDALKKVIASVDHDMLKTILSVEEFENLKDKDWERMIWEFEIHFDVEMKHGSLIQGNEQRKRDTTWWTDIYKQSSMNFYWERYKKYIGTSLPPDVVKTIDNDTDIVMNNLENPISESFARYGMVVGHVQSGKTGNYSALICKAADAGYKFIVVVAGGINNLRDQTQERINESFIGQTRGMQVGAGIGNTQRETMPLCLTTIESDFNKQDADRAAHGFNFENINVPVLLVIKKNTRTLENVIDWLKNQYKGKGIDHAMLVIDDESDYASINTKEENDPTAINLKLRTLLSFFNKYAYVAYTATPYANIFIDHEATHEEVGRDLFPKDFIYALDAPTNYFGARKIFIENADKYLVPITDNETAIPYSHKKDFTMDRLPESLLEAIRLFLLNIAIRNLRGQRGKHNSMLIHATRFTDVHRLLAALTEEYLIAVKKDITAYASLPDPLDLSFLLKDLNKTFEKYLSDHGFPWNFVLAELPSFSDSIVVREVHQKKSVPLEYRKDQRTNAIVIGGASLARGFTVEGLNVSYFLRNTIFYDTLMQMGRWFGYRSGYEDICKIFMPADRITDFANIIEATENLILDFKLMAEQKKTPNDFGLAIQQNPDSALQVTARNKLKNVENFPFSMRLDGTLKETNYLRKDPESIEHNLKAIRNILDVLPKPSKKDGTIIWKNIDRNIVKGFLKDFRIFSKDPLGLTSRMPVAFINKYLEERDTDWDVALYSGSSENEFEYKNIRIQKQIRSIRAKSDCFELQNRQVSSGSAEAVTIEDKQVRLALKNDRRAARASDARPRPILMLHVLETEVTNDPFIPEIAAFGVSFNGSVLSDAPTVNMLINTVYYQSLFDNLNFDKESDD